VAKDRSGTWAVVVSATAAAAISAAAALGSAAITSSASDRSQDQAFENQRKLADRDELRSAFDHAALAFNTALIRAQRGYLSWHTGNRPAGLPRLQALQAATEAFGRNEVRLALRIRTSSTLFRRYSRGGALILEIGHTMQERAPTRRHATKVEDLLFNQAVGAYHSFARLARQRLASQ
jgi:hypothetical protein